MILILKNTDSTFSYHYLKFTHLICILVRKVIFNNKSESENWAFFLSHENVWLVMFFPPHFKKRHDKLMMKMDL